jgi:hypothetical protein
MSVVGVASNQVAVSTTSQSRRIDTQTLSAEEAVKGIKHQMKRLVIAQQFFSFRFISTKITGATG